MALIEWIVPSLPWNVAAGCFANYLFASCSRSNYPIDFLALQSFGLDALTTLKSLPRAAVHHYLHYLHSRFPSHTCWRHSDARRYYLIDAFVRPELSSETMANCVHQDLYGLSSSMSYDFERLNCVVLSNHLPPCLDAIKAHRACK